jgi:hypothetical protein
MPRTPGKPSDGSPPAQEREVEIRAAGNAVAACDLGLVDATSVLTLHRVEHDDLRVAHEREAIAVARQ